MCWRRKREQERVNQPAGFDHANLALINDEIARRMERQTAAGAHLDSKSTFLAGTVVVAAPLFISQGPFTLALEIAALVLYGSAFGTAVMAAMPQRYKDVPEPRDFYERLAQRSTIETLNSLIASRVDSYETNEAKYEHKVKWWRTSIVFLTASLAVSVGAVLHTKDCAQGEPNPTGVLARACRSAP